jgi:hypothetical protein
MTWTLFAAFIMPTLGALGLAALLSVLSTIEDMRRDERAAQISTEALRAIEEALTADRELGR